MGGLWHCFTPCNWDHRWTTFPPPRSLLPLRKSSLTLKQEFKCSKVFKSEFQQLHYIVCLFFFVCVQPKGWSLKRKFWSKHHFRCELWCGKLSVQLGVNKSKHKGTGRFKTTMHISETLHFDILDMKLNRTVIYIYCILYLAFLFHGFLLETWRPPP